LPDNENTTRDIIDNSGALQDHLTYNAFGALTSQAGPAVAAATDLIFGGYTGAFYDNATGLVHDGDRWYMPSIQRWMSQDPIFPLSGSNPYEYCDNSPTNGIDPTGLDGEWWRTSTSSLNYVNPYAWFAGVGYAAGDWIGDRASAVVGLDLASHRELANITTNQIINEGRNANDIRSTQQASGTEVSAMKGLAEAGITVNAASAGMAQPSTVVGEGVGPTCAKSTSQTEAPASTPVGRRGSPLGAVEGNPGATIGGRAYSGHAIDGMQADGIVPSAVDDAIKNGTRSVGKEPGTVAYYSATNNVTVIQDTAIGRIVTVSRGLIKQ
jgi:RHS repeat-associated protein